MAGIRPISTLEAPNLLARSGKRVVIEPKDMARVKKA
jgi:histone H3/H4